MTHSNHHTAAELQREIDADRARIEEQLHAIEKRLSPGQLIDELIDYTRKSGGVEYLGNLGKAVKTNPIPTALMGVSMAWLMATSTRADASQPESDENAYPLAPVQGSVRRLGPVEESYGERYTHFSDDGGNRFRALTDSAGRRAGHFVDESGKIYRGFADAAGRQIAEIRDEAGALLDEASGWASRSWHHITRSAGSVQNTISATGDTLQEQTALLKDVVQKHFRDQPLVGGALAFAVGAAIGATLPHTEQEDQAIGKASDTVREGLSAAADQAMGRVAEAGSEVYERAMEVASDVHRAAKDRIVEEAQNYTAGRDQGS